MACVQKAFGALTTRFWAAPITNPTGRSSSQNPSRENCYFRDKLSFSSWRCEPTASMPIVFLSAGV